MALQRFAGAVVLAAMVLAAGASAQSKNEISGSIGRTFISNQGVPGATFFDNEIHFGNGLSLEATYGRRVLGNEDSLVTLTFEVPFVFNPDEDLNFGMNVIPESYSSFFVTPAARVNVFASTHVSPWVSFGGGFGHFHESSNLVFFGSNPGKIGTTTGVFEMGGGLDVKLTDKFSLRGEFRDFDSGVPQLNVDTGKTRQHNFFVGGGVVWHF
ncbi:MAG TPA: outer membrane beta-barrel protein [Terriglobales bacterium]|jgi:opacity protein-like surface antigen|nr:outer membrane beta-barrel protein [Terriglobales bacterium]